VAGIGGYARAVVRTNRPICGRIVLRPDRLLIARRVTKFYREYGPIIMPTTQFNYAAISFQKFEGKTGRGVYFQKATFIHLACIRPQFLRIWGHDASNE